MVGKQIGQQVGMLKGVRPEVLGCLAVEQEGPQDLPNCLVPGLSDPILLWTIGIGQVDLDSFCCHLGEQVLVDKLCPPVMLKAFEAMSSLALCSSNDGQKLTSGLVLGGQGNRPPIAGVIIHHSEPIALPLATSGRERPNQIHMECGQRH
jgi:hypothetical protein